MLKKRKFGLCLIMFFVIFILLSGFASADIFSWFRKVLTGRASSQDTNVTITVSGDNPAQVKFVSSISPVPALEGVSRAILFSVLVSDTDGYQDINTSSIQANFSTSGESVRQNLSCQVVNSGLDENTSNFSCSIKMWYWDKNTTWDVTVRARDRGNTTWVQNISTSWDYQRLKSMEVSPLALTWPSVSPGDNNQTSNNHPTVVNNTGNYNGTVTITGMNLLGEVDSDQIIYAGNFTVGVSTGAGDPECVGNQLQNNSVVSISNSVANRGNLSAGGGKEEIYYCLTEVPSITSQTYSTNQGGSWTVGYGS